VTWDPDTGQPPWRLAAMHPSWVRWLPCAVASLRVVPADDALAEAYPRRWYDHPALKLPWDDPVWCDPGPVEEWIEQSPGRRAEARSHYEAVVQARTRRIEVFTECCARADVAVPLNLRQLVDCLVTLGVLWEVDGPDGRPWLTANFAANPLDVLALTPQEAAEEAAAQFLERGVLVGIGLRRLAQEQAAGGGSSVWLTLRRLGEEIELTPAAARLALDLLVSQEPWITTVGVDLAAVGLDRPFAVQADHGRLAQVYDMDELIAPEHLL
jgi:Family of unknown function (DUF6042)